MQHQTHIKLLSLVMVTVMAMTCVVIISGDDSEAATDLGSLNLSTGENDSNSTSLYSRVTGSAQDYCDNYSYGDKIYVSEGARVMITGLMIYPEYWAISKTSYESWGLTYYEDGEGDYISGSLSKTGTCTISMSGEHDATAITLVVVADSTPVTSVSISGSTSGEVGDSITLTGGCAKNEGLKRAIEHVLKLKVIELKTDPQLMGALGAAEYARQKGLAAEVD